MKGGEETGEESADQLKEVFGNRQITFLIFARSGFSALVFELVEQAPWCTEVTCVFFSVINYDFIRKVKKIRWNATSPTKDHHGLHRFTHR